VLVLVQRSLLVPSFPLSPPVLVILVPPVSFGFDLEAAAADLSRKATAIEVDSVPLFSNIPLGSIGSSAPFFVVQDLALNAVDQVVAVAAIVDYAVDVDVVVVQGAADESWNGRDDNSSVDVDVDFVPVGPGRPAVVVHWI